MDLLERAAAVEAERQAASRARFGHPGACIPGLFFDWRAEALKLEAEVNRLRGVVDPYPWIKAFNSLEKAVSNVLDDDHPANLDYLDRAHRAALKELGPNPERGAV